MVRTRSRRARRYVDGGVHCGYTSTDGYCCTSRRSGITACDSHMQGVPDVYERMRLDWSAAGAALPYVDYGLAQVSWDMTPFQQNVRAWAEYADSLQKAAPSQQQATILPGKPAVFAVSNAGALTPVPINLSVGAIPQQQQQPTPVVAVTPIPAQAAPAPAPAPVQGAPGPVPQAQEAPAPTTPPAEALAPTPVQAIAQVAPVVLPTPVIAPAANVSPAAAAPVTPIAIAPAAPVAQVPPIVQAPMIAQQPPPGAQNLPATLVPVAAAPPIATPVQGGAVAGAPAGAAAAVATAAAVPTAQELANAHFATDLEPPFKDRISQPLRSYNTFDPLYFMTEDPQLVEGGTINSQGIAARLFPGGSSDMVVPIRGNLIKYHGGRQEVVYITDLTGLSVQQWRELIRMAMRGESESAFASLTVIQGKGMNDTTGNNNIWHLQNDPANKGAVFQAASNFNALEQPRWNAAPGWVKELFFDHTQGPYAVLSTYPATMWRRHAWPVQTGRSMPDNPASYGDYPGVLVKRDVPGVYSGLATTIGGWLDATGASLQGKYATDEEAMDTIADMSTGIGALGIADCDSMMRLESDDRVTILGKPNIINQVLTSAVDNVNSRPNSFPAPKEKVLWAGACLLAAYSNTLFYAWKNRIPKVFLTLIGGGVFGNQHALITTYLMVAMKAMVLHSRSLNDDFCTKMDIRLVLWNGEELSQLNNIQTALENVVTGTIRGLHPNTHTQFLHLQ